MRYLVKMTSGHIETSILIKEVSNEQELTIIKELFQEYAQSLPISLDFQNFQEELDSLPGKYQNPSGVMFLAYIEDQVAGCIALRPFEGEICELKRLFIRKSFRRTGLAEKLSHKVIQQAKVLGYQKIVLDTLRTMTGARKLYSKLGFKETDPYYFNPNDAVFYELILT